MNKRSLLATALLAACLPAAAQLKPGLWEVTSKSDDPRMDQGMAEMQKRLAAMPPEQRRQMEAMMAKNGSRMPTAAAGGGMVTQSCLTGEMAAKDGVPLQKGCQVTRQQRSGNTMKMAFRCEKPVSSGEGEFTFLGDQAYRSKVSVTASEDGKPRTTTMESTGKWLRADCKPVSGK